MRLERLSLNALRLPVVALALGALCACSGSPDTAGQVAQVRPSSPSPVASPAVQRLQPGEPFPAGTFNNLNPIGPDTIDLSADLGRRSVILYYWIAGNRRSEVVFQDLDRLTTELGPDSLALYGVCVPRKNLATAPQIRERLKMLGLRTPVIEDTGFTIGKRVGAERVPHITIIDAGGRLRLTNGASLVQTLTSGKNLADVIRQAAVTGELPTYEPLGRYYPVKELEGRPSPDFRAPLLANQVERRWRRLVDDEKLNVLVFWSIDCPHCRHELPEINTWLRDNQDDVNIVTCARTSDATDRARTKQFSDSNGFIFPTLVDQDAAIADLYGVTTTPTILIMGPDGVIDSAIVSHADHEGDFAETIEQKKRELLPGSAS
jgi:peroxiredoxin